MRRTAYALASAVAIGALLVGCSPADPAPTKSGAPAASSTPSVSAAPSATATAPASVGGCPAGGDPAPAGAVSAKTIDVDGDGRTDTEWIAQVGTVARFGVTTASGASFSYDSSSASPIPRGGFVASLGTRVISMLSDGRGAYLHVIADCSFVQPLSKDGKPYTFDLQNLRGNGTGVGCATVDGALSVVGFQTTLSGGLATVKQTAIVLDAAGTGAGNGASSVVATDAAATDPVVIAANSVSCGPVNIAHGGVSLGA